MTCLETHRPQLIQLACEPQLQLKVHCLSTWQHCLLKCDLEKYPLDYSSLFLISFLFIYLFTYWFCFSPSLLVFKTLVDHKARKRVRELQTGSRALKACLPVKGECPVSCVCGALQSHPTPPPPPPTGRAPRPLGHRAQTSSPTSKLVRNWNPSSTC